jgi:uncharacterized membrane protein
MNKIKFNFQTEWFSLLMILTVVAIAIYAYPLLPDKVPSHWNMAGEIDGWASRNGHIFGIGGLVVGMYLLFLFLPHFEPRREHFLQSLGFYQMIRNFMMAFFALLFGVTTYIGLTGTMLAMDKIIPVAVGVLFILIGNYLPQIKSNFFMGIRTPWALDSEENWRKTHHLGAYTFVVGGLLFLVSPFIPTPLNFYLPIAGILFAGFFPMLMSYIWFKQSHK